jgi:hypothetical protein
LNSERFVEVERQGKKTCVVEEEWALQWHGADMQYIDEWKETCSR